MGVWWNLKFRSCPDVNPQRFKAPNLLSLSGDYQKALDQTEFPSGGTGVIAGMPEEPLGFLRAMPADNRRGNLFADAVHEYRGVTAACCHSRPCPLAGGFP